MIAVGPWDIAFVLCSGALVGAAYYYGFWRAKRIYREPPTAEESTDGR